MKVILIGSTAEECQKITQMLAGVVAPAAPTPVVQPAKPAVPVTTAQPEKPQTAAQPAVSTVEVPPKTLETNNVAAANQNAAAPAQADGEATLEHIRNIAQSLIEAGKREPIKEMLVKYGAKTVATLDPKHFNDALADLKAVK